jgi:hypothetical protein
MREKIPDLIDSYKELAKPLGMPIDITGLEDAYDNFLTTGDTTAFEKEKENVDKKIEKREEQTAITTYGAAADLMLEAAREGRGWEGSSEYNIDLGEPGKEANAILKDVFGDWWDGDNIEFAYDDPGNILKYYEGAIKARDKLKEAGLENTAAYERLNEDIKQMSEHAEDMYTAQASYFEATQKKLLASQNQGLDTIKLQNGQTANQISNL